MSFVARLRTADRGRLIATAIATLLAFNALGLVVSLIEKAPKEFGGVGDPDNVLGEFPTQGTLFAAPLAPLLVLILGLWLRGCGRWFAILGLLAVIVVGVLFVVGTLGEPWQPQASDPPLALLIVWRSVGIALSVSLIGLAGADLYGKVRMAGAVAG